MSAAHNMIPMIEPPGYRKPPQNLECEQALLGILLYRNETLHSLEFLEPRHFFEPVHQRIFEAIREQVLSGKQANPITLGPVFAQDPALQDAGGVGYLARLMMTRMVGSNAVHYGKSILDACTRREIIQAAEDAIEDAGRETLEGSAEEVMAALGTRLQLIEAGRDTTGELGHVSSAADRALEAAEHAYKNRGKITGTSTGLKPLDRKTGGLQPGDLLIIAGRPSMGKTALVTNIAHNVAKAYQAHTDDDGKQVVDAGGVVAFFSLEMSAQQLATRIIAGESGVSAERIRSGEVDQDEFNRFHDEKLKLDRIPLFIDDQTSVTTGKMRSRARRIKRQHGLHLIIVDYLQLLDGADGMSEQNRTQQISTITRGLKTMAKELGVPVIALSQLSRAVELREDRRPQLADLRDSGSIEQDADIVMFCYREEYYLERSEPTSKGPKETDEKFDARRKGHFERLNACAGKGEVIIGKQRHGPTATVNLSFNGPQTKWFDPYEQGNF
jgi:replicative DNA helicase